MCNRTFNSKRQVLTLVDCCSFCSGERPDFLALVCLTLVLAAFSINTEVYAATDSANLDPYNNSIAALPELPASQYTVAERGDSPLTTNLDSIFFGTWDDGDIFTRKLILSHSGSVGDDPVVIDTLFLDEHDEQRFKTDFRGPQSLWPGENLSVEISFSPITTGMTHASLFITHSYGTTLVALSGIGDPKHTDASQTQLAENIILPSVTTRAAPAFGKSELSGTNVLRPTSLQFGPDDRLYVAEIDGQIKIHSVQRNNANRYVVTATETLNHIKNIQNHNDNGSLNNNLTERLVSGLLVTGTAANPVIYVNSSDPRVGGGASGASTNLDTNSTVLSRLTKNGNTWQKTDLVRGLPRSEEYHQANGIAINQAGDKLYVAMAGNTNQGAPSNNFALLPEYALSAAILEINLAQIGNSTYDIPTLDDENRAGSNDRNDPFGGNRGKNQAILVPGGPVQVYSPGFRNPYDIVITQSGRMYTWDNGSNAGWGARPLGEGPRGVCSNGRNEPGDTRFDALHFIPGPGYYGGHPNPTRGNDNNTFNNSNPQSPVPSSNPIECQFRGAQGSSANKHPLNQSLTALPTSTNGLTEYTAGNFSNGLQGNLLAATFNNQIVRVKLNAGGTAATSTTTLFSNVGGIPLDVTAVADSGMFPGTIWVADFAQSKIIAFEPNDYLGTNTGGVCNPATGGTADADQDGFSNSDELANNTDPCSAADLPADADGDQISDLTDPDDDNDGLNDEDDPFALDPANGANTALGILYDWENNSAPAPFIANLGFSGLLINGIDNYQDLFDLDQMTIGGAAGVLTIDNVSTGDPFNALNSQEHGFQFGVDVTPNSPVFQARTRIIAPFAGVTPQRFQSMGLFIGTGDQDNYIKLVVNTDGQNGGFQFAKEVNGRFSLSNSVQDAVFGSDAVDLVIEVDPATLTATPYYQIINGNQSGPLKSFGNGTDFPMSWLTGSTRLAVGIISTAFRASSFSATWDFIEVVPASTSTIADNSIPANPSPVNSAPVNPPPPNPTNNTGDSSNVNQQPVRINAGGPQIIANGMTWLADNPGSHGYVSTGNTHTFSNQTIDTSTLAEAIPVQLLQSERWDAPSGPEMQWDIPLAPGTYDVRLYYAETFGPTRAIGARVFSVSIEGNSVADNVDIFATVGGNTALMQSFIVNSDSNLDIDFTHVTENPAIKAIEILPLAIPPQTTVNIPSVNPTPANPTPVNPTNNTGGSANINQQPIRINAGGPQVIANGMTWLADNPGSHGYVSTGNTHTFSNQTIDTSTLTEAIPAQLLQSERWDAPSGPEMQWDIPLVPGTYDVRLYYAETFGPTRAIGARVFSVSIEGNSVANNVDIFATVGGNTALMQSFIVNSDSNLDIDFTHVTENPAIKAIEILPF